MRRISTTSRYVIDIIRPDLFPFGNIGDVDVENLEKLRYVNLRTGDRFLIKFDI